MFIKGEMKLDTNKGIIFIIYYSIMIQAMDQGRSDRCYK